MKDPQCWVHRAHIATLGMVLVVLSRSGRCVLPRGHDLPRVDRRRCCRISRRSASERAKGFAFEYEVPVRFRDVDAMAMRTIRCRVVYRGSARRVLAGGHGRSDLDSIDYVLKKITVEYHARILFPALCAVACACQHIGKTRLRLATRCGTPTARSSPPRKRSR